MNIGTLENRLKAIGSTTDSSLTEFPLTQLDPVRWGQYSMLGDDRTVLVTDRFMDDLAKILKIPVKFNRHIHDVIPRLWQEVNRKLEEASDMMITVWDDVTPEGHRFCSAFPNEGKKMDAYEGFCQRTDEFLKVVERVLAGREDLHISDIFIDSPNIIVSVLFHSNGRKIKTKAGTFRGGLFIQKDFGRPSGQLALAIVDQELERASALYSYTTLRFLNALTPLDSFVTLSQSMCADGIIPKDIVGRLNTMVDLPMSFRELYNAERKLDKFFREEEKPDDVLEDIEDLLPVEMVATAYDVSLEPRKRPTKTWMARATTPVKQIDMWNILAQLARNTRLSDNARLVNLVQAGSVVVDPWDLTEVPPKIDWSKV